MAFDKLQKSDFVYLKRQGLEAEEVKRQYKLLLQKNCSVQLHSNCKVNSGIQQYSVERQQELVDIYKHKSANYSLSAFIPASGSGSRMFNPLRQNLTSNKIPEKINRVTDLAISVDLNSYLSHKHNIPLESFIEKDNYEVIHDAIFNYFEWDKKPKALIPFHKYQNRYKTAFEEHLHEVFYYLQPDKNSCLNIHFTIPEDFVEEFKTKSHCSIDMKSEIKTTITYSYQEANTRTICTDDNDQIVRDDENQPLLRPGGHGSLLQNLNNIKTDIIFMKNIDNISIRSFHHKNSFYKMVLAGALIEVQKKCFDYLLLLHKSPTPEALSEIQYFLETAFQYSMPSKWDSYDDDQRLNWFINILDRPIRVCSVVKNEGEPGGAPFWVQNENLSIISPQIVEKSQINLTNPSQKEIFTSSTHFNPVDIVASFKRYNGKFFNLYNFTNSAWAILTEKTHYGEKLTALEHPGLWNGGMYHWNTLFVDLPSDTFNPVKTILDLLKVRHFN